MTEPGLYQRTRSWVNVHPRALYVALPLLAVVVVLCGLFRLIKAEPAIKPADDCSSLYGEYLRILHQRQYFSRPFSEPELAEKNPTQEQRHERDARALEHAKTTVASVMKNRGVTEREALERLIRAESERRDQERVRYVNRQDKWIKEHPPATLQEKWMKEHTPATRSPDKARN